MTTRKLKCIRMSPRALEDIAHPNTIMTFYNVPVDPATNRKIAVTFDTPKNSYWAVGSTRDKQYTVGVEKRMDGRWCWVIEKP